MNQKKRLGLNGSELFPIGLGTFSFSHAYGHADAAASSATLSRALELGCRLIDTADTYSTGTMKHGSAACYRDVDMRLYSVQRLA
jgi:aryl-alcohol dehydrogenase-like predicted oxidoreductase